MKTMSKGAKTAMPLPSFMPARRSASPQRSQEEQGAGSALAPLGYDFGRIRVHSDSAAEAAVVSSASADRSALESCPLALSSPRVYPYGAACHTHPVPIRAKLAVSQPGDRYEREADQVAEQIAHMPDPCLEPPADPGSTARGGSVQVRPLADQITPLAQRQAETEDKEEEEEALLVRRQATTCAECEDEEPMQAKSASTGARQPSPHLETQIRSLRGGGQPLDTNTRARMEPRLGHDFSQVRVHSDFQAATSAQALGARAFTVGRDVFFGAGEYAPATGKGTRLLAHELTHVVQSSAGSRSTGQAGGTTVYRTVQSDVERIERLLSYGLFDWAITDADAIEALEILSNLPPSLQASALRRINLGRLRENLPQPHIPVLERIIAAAGGVPPGDVRATVERINDLLSYGIFDWAITDAEATEALNLLLALPAAEQQRVVLVINHQRLYDNLPTESQKAQLEAIRSTARTHEAAELATMEGHRTRARAILDRIRANADAMTLPSPPAGGAFETWLSSTYLSAYCSNPGRETADPAIERMTEEGAGGFSKYGYGLLRGMADAARSAGISYIDSPYLLGTPAPASVTAAGFFDPWSQGPNPTDLMHFAAGIKWSWAPAFLVQWYFIHYEETTEEGWQLFGLDALNDVIAEEGGRLLAIDLKAGRATCSSAGVVDLDPYFQRGRSFLRSRLSERDLDRLAMRVYQPHMVVATGAGGGGVVSRALWNRTIMEQVMAGVPDATILTSPDARILTLLYHLMRRG